MWFVSPLNERKKVFIFIINILAVIKNFPHHHQTWIKIYLLILLAILGRTVLILEGSLIK